jgi:glycine cleavage system regulatory protein
LQLPEDVSVEQLREDLESVAQDLMVDVTLAELEGSQGS